MTDKEQALNIIEIIDDAIERDKAGFHGNELNDEAASRFSDICDAVEEIESATQIKDYTIFNESDDPSATVEMRFATPIYMNDVSGTAKAFADAVALSDCVSIFTDKDGTVAIHFIVKDYWRE